MILVNGKREDIVGMTVSQYLEREGYKEGRIAVEYNGALLPRAEYSITTLLSGDKIEIVHFVGGG